MPRIALPALILLIGLLLGFAPAPVYREGKGAPLLSRMQGTWEMNDSVGPGGRRSTFVRIKDGTWTYVFVTDGVESEGTPTEVILDDRSEPAAIDLKLRNPGPGVSPTVLRGLVKVEGKTLSVCYSPATNARRPRAFADARPRDGAGDKDASPLTMTLRKVRGP